MQKIPFSHAEEEEGAEDKKDSKEDEQQEDGDKAKEIEDTQTSVINSYHFVRNYTYDSKNYLWCELTFAVSYVKCSSVLC